MAAVEVPEREAQNSENALDVLRKRFFKGFTYNLNDPRSPSLNLNRTPLVFEDTMEKSLSLDDTFADLLVEPRLPETVNIESKSTKEIENTDDAEVEVDVEMSDEKVILDLEANKEVPHTPIALQQEFDPRSPSIGVERTPILFTDDEVDDANEDLMLENILATLTLNLNTSGNSSIVSMPTQNTNVEFNDNNDLSVSAQKPMNKHLDRVRTNKKSSPKAMQPRKPKRRLSRQQIYEDRENHLPTTPKLKITQLEKQDSSAKGKRTPLSCVRNRNARSRSVESSAKSLKTRLALTSFDDTLNPTDNNKVPNLRIMQQGSQDSLEL